MRKAILFSLALLMILALFTGAISLADAAKKPQTKCPIMGEPINKEAYTDYQGKRIYFCCKMCIEKFNAKPKEYISKMEKEGIELEKTPTAEEKAK